jgi:hypothetical protein
MQDPTSSIDVFYKMTGVLVAACGGFLWILKRQADKSKSDEQHKSKFEAHDKKLSEVDKHLEFQDENFESVRKSLNEISQQINKFSIFDLRLTQQEKENVERKEEIKLMMRKLDSIWNKMNQLELTINNKANRS